jgi:exopolyphosphatase/guanosine-5'-triphosphate,3'-diphosphate pyrophosphatase
LKTVAVIDVGSNSIKMLVAAGSPGLPPRALASNTLEARIGAGISAERPSLGEAAIERGLKAVSRLASEARAHGPVRIAVVATSAVRDASNGADFGRRLEQATGLPLRILSGDEEADLIGRGLICDPALSGIRNFEQFDLGGGSLEALAFVDRRRIRAVSLQLGCVRLTERFVSDSSSPVAPEALRAIGLHVEEAFRTAGFDPILAPGAVAIGTGGSLTTARAMLGAQEGRSLEQTPPTLPVSALEGLLKQTASLGIGERRQLPGMTAERADVLPAALATLLAVARLARADSFHHSLFNLRWGVAAELIGSAD